MHKIDIKPLSVNEAWQGKRFKTPKYNRYEQAILLLLPKINVPLDKKLWIWLEFGQSNSGADWDNPIKSFVDILSKKYGFNDKKVYNGFVSKVIVKKGEEYVKFKISYLNENKEGNNAIKCFPCKLLNG